MIDFDGQPIPGTHSIVVASSPDFHVKRSYFWGLLGASEIIGGLGSRKLSLFMWLHDQYATRTSLEIEFETLQGWVGRNGTLMEFDLNNNATGVYEHSTLDSVTRIPFDGRNQPDPVKDIANTVDGGWVQPIQLEFTQLDMIRTTS